MKLLSDSDSESVCGGALVSLNLALNNIIAPQINVAAVTGVAPLFGSASPTLDQSNSFTGFQLARLFRR